MPVSGNSCILHPDEEGIYYCAKYNRYYCERCLECKDPTAYCKFRKSCVLFELTKHPEEIFQPESPKSSR